MLTITIYLASGDTSSYVQEDTEIAAKTLDSLNPSKIFEEGRLLIGSPTGLGVFNGHRISRIDLQASKTLETLLPDEGTEATGTVIRESEWKEEFMKPAAAADAGVNEGELITTGIEFGLLGNHIVHSRLITELVAPMERFSRISRLLTQPVIRLSLLPFGVTLLNPSLITRIVMQPSFTKLPQDTWLANRIS